MHKTDDTVKPYYLAYEARYRAVYDAGADHWGHTADDEELSRTLADWVAQNDLYGKRILEFACGEGAAGVILSRLGCHYHGVDISPTAIRAAKHALRDYPDASVELLDMVHSPLPNGYDAALDSMGFHMLITDDDRASYLKNAFAALKPGAPMLFYKESYRNANSTVPVVRTPVHSFDEWVALTGGDYHTPMERTVETPAGTVSVRIPLVPARANDGEGYKAELTAAGFSVETFREMNVSRAIAYAASIYVRKPQNKPKGTIDMITFLCYPKCTTCQRARKWLDDNGIAYTLRDIKEDKPSYEELVAWHRKSGLALKKFFNTSGNFYKNNALKDRLPTMSEEEQYALLASDGMAVKRPILYSDDFVCVGFKEDEWKQHV